MTGKQRKKFRNDRFLKHIYNFVDRNYHKDFILTTEIGDSFIKFQTYGATKLTKDQLNSIKPMIYAQKLKEITIKLFVQELAHWWSTNSGWIYPAANTIENITGDWVMKKALLEIKTKIWNSDMVTFLESYTGLTQEQKDKYLNFWLNSNK